MYTTGLKCMQYTLHKFNLSLFSINPLEKRKDRNLVKFAWFEMFQVFVVEFMIHQVPFVGDSLLKETKSYNENMIFIANFPKDLYPSWPYLAKTFLTKATLFYSLKNIVLTHRCICKEILLRNKQRYNSSWKLTNFHFFNP